MGAVNQLRGAGKAAAMQKAAAAAMPTYINGDVDADAVMLGPGPHVLVPLLGLVVADYQRVLGQVLEEAFRLRPVDEEVERLGDGAQRQEGEDRLHVDGGGTRAELDADGVHSIGLSPFSGSVRWCRRGAVEGLSTGVVA